MRAFARVVCVIYKILHSCSDLANIIQNLQKEPWFPCKEGYTLIQQVGNENLVEGPRGAKQKKDCEVKLFQCR